MLAKLPFNQRVKPQMSAKEKALTDMQANNVNKKVGLNNMGEKRGQLGKSSFLKLLVTQLKHQDPTKPLEDREFIAQMAQFSSLEQMTNIGKEFKQLIKSSKSTEANSLLGKKIDAFDPSKNQRITGVVSSIKYFNDDVRLLVGNQEVSLNHIHAVSEADKKTSDSTIIHSLNKK